MASSRRHATFGLFALTCKRKEVQLLRRNLLSVGFVLALLLAAGAPLATSAQDATPTAAMTAGDLPVVAAGLTNPRGMAWGTDGTLFVALAGTGGNTPGEPPIELEFMGGPTASVVRIEAGCPVAVADGLPSTRDVDGGVTGVADVAILGDQLYALEAAGGDLYGNPGTTSGVYQVNADGTTTLIADTSAWLAANPPEAAGWTAPPEGYPNPGNPFAMVADEATGVLWVVDALNGLVFTVTPGGAITLAANLSEGHPVPTGIAADPAGGIYVGNLTPAPYVNGAAKVVHVAADGTVTGAVAGLTAVTGVAVGDDGTLYAVEMSTGNTEEPPFMVPGSGRLVRQSGADSFEAVVSGLMFPVGLKAGPDGALYVALPAFGSDDGSGQIVRVDVTSGAASPVAETMREAPECALPVEGTPETPRVPETATPAA
jgi:sugar lactone lactonase YvrE